MSEIGDAGVDVQCTDLKGLQILRYASRSGARGISRVKGLHEGVPSMKTSDLMSIGA